MYPQTLNVQRGGYEQFYGNKFDHLDEMDSSSAETKYHHLLLNREPE